MPGIAPSVDWPNLPLVSIVTPSFNQGQFIRHTIKSVLEQDYPRLEYWVIDGGSTDQTLNILREYEADSRFHWLSEPDKGQAHAISKGWQKSTGQILAWLNADDLYRPQAVTKAVKALAAHPQAALVCGGAYVIDELGQQIGQIPAPYLNLDDMLKMQSFLPQPAVFMQADFIKTVGGINISLHYAMDFDLFLRLAAVAPLHYTNDYLAEYRFHQTSKTSTHFYKLRKEAAHVVYDFFKTTPLPSGASVVSKRRRLSYAYLVEAYADLRLGRPTGMMMNALKGTLVYPPNISWLFKRAFRHLSDKNEHPFG